MSWRAEPRASALRATLLWGVAFACLPVAARADTRWSFPVSAGYDLYIHDYSLAADDTTEVIQELNLQASLFGNSGFGDRHRWNLGASASAGSELFRQSFDAGFRYRDSTGEDRVRADLIWLARQFRQNSAYSLSSDNHEGRLLTAFTPWMGNDVGLDLIARGRYVDYARPSTLEVDYVQGSAGAAFRSPRQGLRNWSLGARYVQREYPDSARINRTGAILEGEFDNGGLDRQIRAYHRSERRLIEDETARPSAWFHWSDLDAVLPLRGGEILLRGSSEIWDYDQATGAWVDSWLLRGEAGPRWGEATGRRTHLLLATERLFAGDEPEAYVQAGLQLGAELLADRLSGSASMEIGRRWYTGDLISNDAFVLEYSDFNYLALWLMANWRLSEHFSLDLAANFEPESHTEKADDVTLGFGSLRLVWRP